MTAADWFIINDVDKLDTPALVVYPDRVKENICTIAGMIDEVGRLRPHVKTFKNREVTLIMLEAGISKFKCATIAEAEMLGTCTAPDVLLAYQPVGPKLGRFIQLISSYPKTKYSCLVDNAVAASEISEAAIENQIQILVYIDLNVGMNRTGILPGEEALQLYLECNELAGLVPVGLHAYDGHIHDPDLQIRKEIADACFEQVSTLKGQLVNTGLPEPVIVIGGSPSFPIHAKRKNVECSPGTFVYWDKGYSEMLAEQPYLPAALVVTRVISLPGETTLCLDVGHKSIAAERELDRRVNFINAPELVPLSQSEEHLVVDAGKNHRYRIGDVFFGLPYHICPTVASYECAITVENNTITGEWRNIARDRKIAV